MAQTQFVRDTKLVILAGVILVADGVTMVRAQELDLANWEEPLVLWSRSDLAIGKVNGWLQTPVRPPKEKVGILLLAQIACVTDTVLVRKIQKAVISLVWTTPKENTVKNVHRDILAFLSMVANVKLVNATAKPRNVIIKRDDATVQPKE
jgi:hypothetical protein